MGRKAPVVSPNELQSDPLPGERLRRGLYVETQTTGFDPRSDAVIELGLPHSRTPSVDGSWMCSTTARRCIATIPNVRSRRRSSRSPARPAKRLARRLGRRAGRDRAHPVVLPAWPPHEDVVAPCQGIQMLKRPEVLALLSAGCTHLYRLMALDDPALRFPWPAPLGVRARRWAS